jgi:MFS family permease
MSQTVAAENQTSHEVAPDAQEEPQFQGSRFYAYYVVFVLFTATLLNALDSNVFTSAAPVIARELHLSISSIGVLTSAFTIFLTISIIPVGLWADRTKRSYVIAACLAVWSLATALTALAGSFFSLFVTRMFTGIGEAGYMPAGNSLVADFFHKKQRPKILSLLALATLIGAIGGIVAGGVIAGLGPGTWHLAFLITGVPGLLLALCAWRLREPVRKLLPTSRQAGSSGGLRLSGLTRQLRGLVGSKVFLCTAIYGVLVEFTAVGLQAYFPTLLQQRDAFGLTPGQAATFAGLALGPTAVIGILSGGYLASWLRRRYRSANFLTCVVTTMITAPLNLATLLILMTTHNLVLFTIVMLPSFLINTIHIGPLSAAVLDVAPADQRASTVAIFLFIVRILGTAMAPLVIGFLANGFDPGGQHFAHSMAGHDLTLALLITCPVAFTIASIAGVVGLRLMRRQHEAIV